MVYDSDGGRMVLFGGLRRRLVTDRTWTWDGSTWQRLRTDVSPPARHGHAMAYDPVRDEVVVYGGTGAEGRTLDDTWVLRDDVWVELDPAVSPGPENGSVMEFDPNLGQIVMFGGERDGAAETWTWDGSTWDELAPATSPSGRSMFELTYSPPLDELVLFGGSSSTEGRLRDTWTWDGVTWTRQSPPQSPPALAGYGMATLGRDVVLVGGGAFSAQTWVFTGSTWKLAEPVGAAPAGRSGHAFEVDTAADQAVLYGGLRRLTGLGHPRLRDTWTLELR